ncbi:MAG: hypothetical protein ACE5ID_02765 [Acidobacteriota bacterium]
MTVSTQTAGAFRAGTPAPLFPGKVRFRPGNDADIYDVTPDGQHFLFLEPAQGTRETAAAVTLVQNRRSVLH